VLHGVTGSGKTEIYLRLAARVCDAGRRSLVLVPEIALTPALAGVFRGLFGDRVAILHSGLSDGERHDQWQRIRRGEVDVVVGTRSAVFAPLEPIGLIVVDEEHDGSYKQDESPRYNGRDVAVMRGKRENAVVVLGSATPAVETYQNAMTGRYQLMSIARRVLDRPLATVSLVNMREQYALGGPDLVFSAPLEAAITARLQNAEQVLVLLNRRGFATAVFCRQCGETINCPNCSVSLTVHAGATRRARCHYCNYAATVPATCPKCAAPYLEQIGLGTQRIETEALRLFPAARVARLDRDVLRRRGAAGDLLARFGRREIDLLIGTQMIAKGHDFPNVTLVGVISADVGLGLPDFRAAERTFQLLTQVVGRAGRGETPGEAIIQTLYPDHYSVRFACQQDYIGFFTEEIRYRRALRYPPIVALVNVLVRGPDFRTAFDDATDVADRVRRMVGAARDVIVLGPAPAPMGRIKGEHRVQLFLKGTRRSLMREVIKAALDARPELRRRVTVDVDPLSVL
jgi:primosomal protein N' (replication factor Y)